MSNVVRSPAVNSLTATLDGGTTRFTIPPMTHHETQQDEPKRGALARPLDALAFLLPLIVFYELACLAYPGRVIAFDLLQQFLQLFGDVGTHAPGLAVIVILLATHGASGEPWRIHWRHVAWMYAEAVLLAAPLLAINYLTLLAAGPEQGDFVAQLALGVGAGVYEELVFRLVLLSVVVIIGTDILRLDRRNVGIAAITISSVVFAAHHHRPIGAEEFELSVFIFRTIAGAYLATIFWYRGYGPAAGCHAVHNIALSCAQFLGG